ncbi:RUN and FYVE domain-containing protein 4 isoform X4 [Hippopotamus amphibius kiboko]|uniref:RUN and FYVE domain-containing protein 4 isoform X4 n=1 Tax=Hippopotamus amphibius kiboko TaxID=575201 RepID=UPI0025946C28|nr:RUN and FYVE domain-containing protein 4 isoform X4 [Hippopotamus amphibius kiboko]
MAEEGAVLKMTRNLKAAVYAILQGYGGGRQPVTDASAELHRLCGCLELLLQFDQKEQKSFLRPRKDYWDFLCMALWRQRGDTEPVRFVHSQDKLKTPLGKGRAFIRFCLTHGQLAESLQLCLLNPELTRSCCSNSSRTQGRRPRKIKDSPKEISPTYGDPTGVHPEEPCTSQAVCLQDAPREDRLAGLPRSQQCIHHPPILEKKKEDPRSFGPPQSMWELEGEELQRDKEERAPRTGICLENSTPSIQGQGEGAKGTLKDVIGTKAEGRGVLLDVDGQRTAEGTNEGEAERSHSHRLLASSPKGTIRDVASGSRQDGQGPSIPGELRVLQGLGTKEGSTTEKPQEQTGVTSVTKREEEAEMALQDVVKSLRHGLQKTKEQAQHQEQLLKEQEGELKALQEQLIRLKEAQGPRSQPKKASGTPPTRCSAESRVLVSKESHDSSPKCQAERARLQAELEQKQQEAERRDAMYEEELGGQQDLVRAMKRRVLELIQEKDNLWQKVQHLSSMAPGCCVVCSKIFGRLSRRYPCRLCGGLVCHACSVDYKKRERHCPPCSQRREAQVL